MSVRTVKAGTTDVSVTLRILDAADGTPETGVVFNTAGIDLWYRREGAVSTDITEATLADLTAAHADGGFLHINDGVYRLDLPDAACAAGVAGVQIGGTVTGMVVLAPYIELPVNTAEDIYTRVGAPAGASVSADIAAIEAQTDDIGAAGAGLTAADDAILAILGTPAGASLSADVAAVKVDTAAILVDTGTTLDGKIDTIDTVVDAILVDTGTTLDGKIDTIDTVVDAILVDTAEIGVAGAGLTAIDLPDQTLNITGNITGNLSGSVGSVTGAVGSVTGAVGSVAANGITASSIAADAIGASELAADAVTEIQSGLATAAALTTIDDFLDTEVAAILAAVDTEVAAILALLDDARAEPGQGTPPVNPDLATKVDYLYKSWRNKKDNDGTTTHLYADDAATVDHKQTTSSAGGTVTKGEWITGP